jgi:hypothetical protein
LGDLAVQRSWTSLSLVSIALLTTLIIGCGGSAANSVVASNGSSTSNPSPTPTPAASPTPTPSTPASTVIDNVQDSTSWLTCGACGNNGGTGPVATFAFTPGIATPSESGRATNFSIAANVAFTNAYWYRQQPVINSQINALTYQFDLYIPNGMQTAPQAIEFECQQTVGGWVYNFAWQAEYHGGVWRTFDYGLQQWQSANVAFTPFTPGAWHHILVEYHNDTTSHTVFHDAITVDGVRTVVGITHNAFFSGATKNQFTNAFQLDSNSTATPYNVYVDKMRITYQ